MFLGSVFDGNSLGKWTYDWAVYHHGPSSPISDIAGDMWILLIQLTGKIKRAKENMTKIQTKDNRDMVEEFIGAGYRVTDELRKLLKTCEAPVLRSSGKNRQDGKLDTGAGVEFVETLFGRNREYDNTTKFMQQIRTWIFRFEQNCEAILKNAVPQPADEEVAATGAWCDVGLSKAVSASGGQLPEDIGQKHSRGRGKKCKQVSDPRSHHGPTTPELSEPSDTEPCRADAKRRGSRAVAENTPSGRKLRDPRGRDTAHAKEAEWTLRRS
jgi:hypothetical protein